MCSFLFLGGGRDYCADAVSTRSKPLAVSHAELAAGRDCPAYIDIDIDTHTHIDIDTDIDTDTDTVTKHCTQQT